MSGDAIKELTEQHFVHIIGADWYRRKPRSLDFSDSKYFLDTLEGPEGGLLNKRLDISKLYHLNISRNNLSDINNAIQEDRNFKELRTLRATHNQLYRPELTLPTLRELDLSHNNITLIPPLELLPALEVLILNFNQMTGTWSSVKNAPRLKRLELAHNRYDLLPSELSMALHALRDLPFLSILRLSDNPFTSWFPEYALYAVKAIKTLTKLNDDDVSHRIRQQISQDSLYSLKQFDEVYKTRRQEAMDSGEIDNFHRQTVSSNFYPLVQMIELLDEALAQPDRSLQIATSVYNSLQELDTLPTEEEEVLYRLLVSEEKIEEAAWMFVKKGVLLSERQEQTRSLLYRCFAKLSNFIKGNLGSHCIAALGVAVHSGDEREPTAIDAIREVLIPALKRGNALDEGCYVVLRGLAELPYRESIAVAIGDVLPELTEWWQQGKDRNVLSLIASACKVTENAQEASLCGFPQVVAKELLKAANTKTDNKPCSDLFVILHDTAVASEAASNVYEKEKVHTACLLPDLRKGFSVSIAAMSLEDVKMLSVELYALVALIRSNETIAKEAVEVHHAIDIFLIATKEELSDPRLIAPSVDGLRAVLENDDLRPNHIDYITQELGKMNQLFQCLGLRYYKHLSIVAERHIDPSYQYDDGAKPHNLATDTNPYMNAMFESIVRLMIWYSGNSQFDACRMTNENLNDQQRESVLFSLLQVPSAGLKIAVIDCINLVPLHQLDTDEIHDLVGLLQKSTGTGDNTERMLERVCRQLQRFAKDTQTSCGRLFREDHAERATVGAMDLLVRNESRRTFNDLESQNEKTMLGEALVKLLLRLSQFIELAAIFRTRKAGETMRLVLKYEEDLSMPDSNDILIERTWTGRDLEMLMSCLTGAHRLNGCRKGAFRVVLRIADVLEGRSDVLDRNEKLSLQNLCERESGIWSDKAKQRHLSFLNDEEVSDRAKQHQAFIRMNVVERLMSFVYAYVKTDKAREKSRNQDEDISEIFVSKIKGFTKKQEREFVITTSKNNDGTRPDTGTQLVPLAEEDPGYEDMRGHYLLMRNLQRTCLEANQPVEGSMFKGCLDVLNVSKNIWDNPTEGILRPCYIIAAFLRAFYAATTLPAHDFVRTNCILYLRQPAVLRRLFSLIDPSTPLDCNLMAKLLFLYRKVVEMPTTEAVESLDSLILYDIAAGATHSLLPVVEFILRHAELRQLCEEEQALLTAIASLTMVFAKQIPYIKFSELREVQKRATERSFLRIFSPELTEVLVKMVLYDLQVDYGSSQGTYMAHVLSPMTNASLREEMREACRQSLSNIMQYCSLMKYSLLEKFNKARVFKKLHVRHSYIAELLSMSNLGLYRSSLEIMFAKSHACGERILQLCECYIVSHATAPMNPRLLILTTRSIYILRKAAGESCSMCPPERFCPAPPIIESEMSYWDLTRIVRCFGRQLLVLGFAQTTQNCIFRDVRETTLVIATKKSNVRDRLLSSLYTLSGPEIDDRVAIEQGTSLREQVLEKVDRRHIHLATFAFRQGESPNQLSLFVLTETNFYEFSVVWKHWKISEIPSQFRNNAQDSVDDKNAEGNMGYNIFDDKKRRELELLQGMNQGLGEEEEDSELDVLLLAGVAISNIDIKRRASQAQTHENFSTLETKSMNKTVPSFSMAAQGAFEKQKKNRQDATMASANTPGKKAGQEVVVMTSDIALKTLREVVFGATEEPSMTLRFFSSEVAILFLDDFAREQWRRLLAGILNRSDSASHWNRNWTSDHV